jgi:GNAT superfamily N-acetyltransferase
MRIEPGTKKDWERLCSFHYRGHGISVPRKIFKVTRGDELCGVIVYTYPPPACYGRRFMLPKMAMAELNQKLSTINRVVIHPKYRTIGLGEKLIHETLPQVGTPYVELIAVMARYSPFAEKAGMQKVAAQHSIESVKKLMETLRRLGFNLQLLSSERYVKSKLDRLTEKQTTEIKIAFVASKHPRFKKEVAGSGHEPYGKTSEYVAYVEKADNLKLGRLIKILALLAQKKVYLFWSKALMEEVNSCDSKYVGTSKPQSSDVSINTN